MEPRERKDDERKEKGERKSTFSPVMLRADAVLRKSTLTTVDREDNLPA